jgi:hypothetical protein
MAIGVSAEKSVESFRATMSETEIAIPQPTASPRDCWLFWLGQIISSFGSSITAFALPLLLIGNAHSFLVSAASLAGIRTSFADSGGAAPATSIPQAIRDGLLCIVHRPGISD